MVHLHPLLHRSQLVPLPLSHCLLPRYYLLSPLNPGPWWVSSQESVPPTRLLSWCPVIHLPLPSVVVVPGGGPHHRLVGDLFPPFTLPPLRVRTVTVGPPVPSSRSLYCPVRPVPASLPVSGRSRTVFPSSPQLLRIPRVPCVIRGVTGRRLTS